MSLTAAGLAGLFFTLDDAHAFPAAWLANRNALLCLVFGVSTLILHMQWRITKRPFWLVLSLAVFATGLFCGEATLGAFAYLLAWHLAMEEKPFRSLAGLLFYVAIVFFWRGLYGLLGYGTEGSLIYIDPVRQPFLFLTALAERWPILVAGQFFQVPLDLWLMITRDKQIVFSCISALLSVVLLWLVLPLFKRPLVRFCAMGAGLSMIPLCAAGLMGRLLLYPGIGAFGLLALFVETLVFEPNPFGKVRKFAAICFLVLHIPLAGLFLYSSTASLPEVGKFFTRASRNLPRDEKIKEQTFVFVNGNDFPVFYGRVVPIISGDPAPRRVAQLASMSDANRIYRKDLNTLIITPASGFVAHPLDRFLVSSKPFHAGDRIERPDYQAEVLSITNDGRPAVVSFRFHLELEHPSLRLLCWKDDRLQEFELPEVGGATMLPKIVIFKF